MKKIVLYNLFFGMLIIPNFLLAQEPKDTLAVAENKFEDAFYESLKQKGIENYDRAIQSLEKCISIDPKSAVAYFELGKNYFFDKKYDIAYTNFQKSAELDPNNRWSWAGMYDVCYEKKEYNKAIPLVEKLIFFNANYKEDLVSLYMNTAQYDKALVLINELNETVGKLEKRELYKADILRDAKYQGSEKENLIAQINKNPKEENNYIQLIYLYSQSNQEEKALEVAKQLEKEIPTSDWAQVSLFKFHLNNNDGEKAIKAMDVILPSNKIDSKIKHRVLNEFLIFVNNNLQYSSALEKAVGYFDTDKQVAVAKEIGKFYQAKNDFANAAKYYQKYLNNHADDMETILLFLQTLSSAKEYSKLIKITNEQITLFPTQPQLYLYNALANNQLKNYKKAKEMLESGLDFIVDDAKLETNFYLQLSESYNGLGDIKKKEMYFAKAVELAKK